MDRQSHKGRRSKKQEKKAEPENGLSGNRLESIDLPSHAAYLFRSSYEEYNQHHLR